MDNLNLLDEAKLLLSNSGETLNQIAFNSDINYHWLAKFKQGKFDNPGVIQIEKLCNYLRKSH